MTVTGGGGSLCARSDIRGTGPWSWPLHGTSLSVLGTSFSKGPFCQGRDRIQLVLELVSSWMKSLGTAQLDSPHGLPPAALETTAKSHSRTPAPGAVPTPSCCEGSPWHLQRESDPCSCCPCLRPSLCSWPGFSRPPLQHPGGYSGNIWRVTSFLSGPGLGSAGSFIRRLLHFRGLGQIWVCWKPRSPLDVQIVPSDWE